MRLQEKLSFDNKLSLVPFYMLGHCVSACIYLYKYLILYYCIKWLRLCGNFLQVLRSVYGRIFHLTNFHWQPLYATNVGHVRFSARKMFVIIYDRQARKLEKCLYCTSHCTVFFKWPLPLILVYFAIRLCSVVSCRQF